MDWKGNTNKNHEKKIKQQNKNATKTSIWQWLRTDLGRSENLYI